ncbi:nucleoside deaminase [Neptunomonas japonica]|uniref:Cytosine deaminase n=1 Tax=Neptunomonas japonica JAMM 1380 TaxID=1441457 RepID=A0A7R6SX71_9GAMM|nr:nucleoside deaminase [Neptunomonas japonica]BBB30525.1 cytosine deaminase [Neptunomonas japonica JAMM 1380]
MEFDELIKLVKEYQINPQFRDEEAGFRCCELALAALQSGNYGVGAVLLDADGQVLVEEKNVVFSTQFCSSAHAEMRVLDQYEAYFIKEHPPALLKLVVSLEPCPMCLSRILLSGIGVVKYLVEDAAGGMVSHMSRMPPAWQNLASLQSFYHAHVSSELRQLAKKLSQHNLVYLRAALLQQRGSDA